MEPTMFLLCFLSLPDAQNLLWLTLHSLPPLACRVRSLVCACPHPWMPCERSGTASLMLVSPP